LSVVLSPSQLSRIYGFGDFEFCVRSGELRRNGSVVRLQQQPSRVLLALLEYSGEVITREELRERVWPDAAVQDFDNSLRVAINKLRQALDDDPENPQYVETLPRRGYRWLYPLTVHEHPHAVGGDDAPHDREAEGEDSSAGQETIDPEVRSRLGVGAKSIWVTALLVLVVLVAARYLRREPAPANPRVVPLTTYPGLEYMPSFSPDGKQVAFAWTGTDAGGPYSVYIKTVGDERAHQLTETPAGAGDGDPVWSPDGKSIYFFRRADGKSGIYVAPVEGGPVRQLIATSLGGQRIRRARFDVSPTAKLLVYPDGVPGKKTVGLFLLDLDTMKSRQITDPPANSIGDGDPAFSHDGKTVAYQRNINDLGEVYVVPSQGGLARRLTSNFIADFIDGLAWTADDREILLGGNQLRRISVSSSEQKIAIDPFVPGPVLFPAIHDHSLAYVQSTLSANVWKLELRDRVHAVGAPIQLISSTHQQAAPAYSPDGSRIAFQSDRSGEWEIWTCARDGSDSVQLTHFRGPLTGTPRWSPDGKQIVFDSRASGASHIYMVPAAGGEPRQLTNQAEGSEVPSWSRDGKWVFYSTNKDGAANIWKMPVQGGASQVVTRNGGIYAAESFDGKYIYFSRNAQDPTIWRVPAGGGAEEVVSGAPRPFDTSHWVLTATGIYVIDTVGDLQFYQFDNGRTSKVYHDQRFITDWSMAISPDGREVLWAQIDARLADLVLVENFR
jgi:Tol biopolymer transport system component/DNA-binding winged helix-turn-helix (wHTH) protein